jgi:hypothetical protein
MSSWQVWNGFCENDLSTANAPNSTAVCTNSLMFTLDFTLDVHKALPVFQPLVTAIVNQVHGLLLTDFS